MVAQSNKSLAEAERKLTMLLLEVRGTEVAERVRLYVEKFASGRKLSEYLRDETAPVKERAALATTLVEILLSKDYSRLPEVPGGWKPTGNGSGNGHAAVRQPRAVAPMVDEPDEMPARDELREMIREEVRKELAGILETIAKALREKY